MKNLILLFAFLCMVSYSNAQNKPATSSGNCFKDWYTLFRDRGANPVPDGTHEVVITIRNGDYSDCYMGKVEVAGGILTSKLLVKKADGSYEEFDKKVSSAYMDTSNKLRADLRTVSDGMSASVPLDDGEIIRLFFFNALKEKPKGNVKAPTPTQLIKN